MMQCEICISNEYHDGAFYCESFELQAVHGGIKMGKKNQTEKLHALYKAIEGRFCLMR